MGHVVFRPAAFALFAAPGFGSTVNEWGAAGGTVGIAKWTCPVFEIEKTVRRMTMRLPGNRPAHHATFGYRQQHNPRYDCHHTLPAYLLHIHHKRGNRQRDCRLAGKVFVVVVVLTVGVGIHAVRVLPIGHMVVAMIATRPLNNAPHKTHCYAGYKEQSSNVFCHELLIGIIQIFAALGFTSSVLPSGSADAPHSVWAIPWCGCSGNRVAAANARDGWTNYRRTDSKQTCNLHARAPGAACASWRGGETCGSGGRIG